MLNIEKISKSFGELSILKSVSFSVEKGSVVSIVGSSGAGKSTLLHIMGTLDKPDEGKMFLNQIDAFSLKGSKLSKFRNQEIGFVFQFHHLLPEFNAIENVAMPGLIAGRLEKEVKSQAEELLISLNLKDRISHKPSQLSGGEQQRVAIARALINSPSVILADEPTGNLDSKHSEELMDYIYKLREDFNQTFVMVTHDEKIAAESDRTLVLNDGAFNGV